jgi:hypothetical protein
MKTIQEINSAIMSQTWTNVELNSMQDAIKWNRAQLAKQIKWSISKGDNVQFTSNKNGMTYKGTVEKVAIKYVTVATPQGKWRVPASMLETV